MTHQFDNVGSEGTAAPSHTPGPWNYDGGDGCEITAPSAHINAYGHACAQLVAVATLQADLNDGADGMPERSEDEAKANARLIAAAPDLLAALDALQRAYLNACKRLPVSVSDIQAEESARAAIARAKGESDRAP